MPRVSAIEKEAIRRRLIDAGKTAFAERGLAGARLDQISVAAGHARGTVYNYFPDKEALFFEIVGEWCDQLSADAVHLNGSPRRQLVGIAELDVVIARKDPDLSRVIVQQMPALLGSHAEAIGHAVAPALDLIAGLFAAGLDSGDFQSPHQPAALARLFIGAISWFESEALLPEPAIDLDDVVELVDRHFLEGLVAA